MSVLLQNKRANSLHIQLVQFRNLFCICLSEVLDPFLRSATSLCLRSRSLEWTLSTPSTAAFWASTWVVRDSALCFKKAAPSSSSWLWHFISEWVPPSCPPPSNSTTSSTCVTSPTYSRYIFIYICIYIQTWLVSTELELFSVSQRRLPDALASPKGYSRVCLRCI